VIQQISGESQCLDGTLNEYREKCLDLLKKMSKFSINHVSREDNARVNTLAQQASRYGTHRERFEVK
jgi:site-specific recombinase XerC